MEGLGGFFQRNKYMQVTVTQTMCYQWRDKSQDNILPLYVYFVDNMSENFLKRRALTHFPQTSRAKFEEHKFFKRLSEYS